MICRPGSSPDGSGRGAQPLSSRFSDRSVAVRAAINVACLAACVAAMLVVVLGWN
jgi:hypothetical protein